MCQASSHVVLTETDKGQISWCKGCKNYSLLYNNCCLSLNDQEIHRFRKILEHLREEDYQFDFRNEKHAIVKNHNAPLGISLSREDAENLLMIIHEATAMKEVFGIIYN